MKVRELLDYIQENKIPENADVFIFADHGQNGENASDACFSRSVDTDDYDEMIWEFDGFEDGYYNEDVMEKYDKRGAITAICIYGD